MGTVDGLNTTWNSFIHQNIAHNNVNIVVTPNSINKGRGQLLVPVAADRQTTHTHKHMQHIQAIPATYIP